MKLTELQKVILHELIKGSTNAQIGEKIYYSESSVKNKIKQLFKKFSVKKRVSLVREAVILKEQGLL